MATTEAVMAEVKHAFNPEFINRIDEIILFDALSDADLGRITRNGVDNGKDDQGHAQQHGQ
mgnify:CR=1 FL=1